MFAAIALGLLAFIVSGQVKPLMPEGTDFGYFTQVNIALGLLVGWIMIGPRAGRGLVPGITNGITGMLSMVFWALFVQGAYEMFSRAMGHRYHGPFEAVMAILELTFEFAGMILVPNILVTLLVGGVLAGLAGEFASKRFR